LENKGAKFFCLGKKKQKGKIFWFLKG